MVAYMQEDSSVRHNKLLMKNGFIRHKSVKVESEQAFEFSNKIIENMSSNDGLSKKSNLGLTKR